MEYTAAYRRQKAVPEQTPPVSSIRGFVVVRDSGGNVISPLATSKTCRLFVSGPAELVDEHVVLNSGVGMFELKPTPGNHGVVTVKADFSSYSVKKSFSIRGAVYKDYLMLDFEQQDQLKRVKSHYLNARQTLDHTVRPNANVLSIALDNPKVKGHFGYMCNMDFKHMKVPHKTAGVSFDSALSQDCTFDSVTLRVLINGKRLGTVGIRKQKAGQIQHYRLVLKDVGIIENLVKVNQCMFQIQKAEGFKGTVYIDDITLIGYE